MEIRLGIEDDWILSVVPYMGIGEFSAFVAGEIEFGEDTSWAAPVINEKSDLETLCLDPNNKWFRKLNEATRYMVRKIAPYRIPLGRGYYSPLDLAWALRGEAIYMDFYEDPQFVHNLMEFALSATEWFARAQAAEIFAPDVVHELSAWHCGPNRVAVSEDISSLISPSHYAQYGAPYTQRLFDSFGIGEVHCHSAGPHVVPEFLKLYDMGVHQFEKAFQIAAYNWGQDCRSRKAFVYGNRLKKAWHHVNVEDYWRAYVKFESGLEMQVVQSNLCAAPKPLWVVLGTRGAAVIESWDWEKPAIVNTYVNNRLTRVEYPIIPPCSIPDYFDRLAEKYYRNLADHVLMDLPLIITPEWARNPVAAIELSEKASLENRVLEAEFIF
jgi:hypothetical protein